MCGYTVDLLLDTLWIHFGNFQVQFAPMKPISRRDFLKLGGLGLAGLAFTSFSPDYSEFEDIDLVRVIGTRDLTRPKEPPSVSIYKKPDDTSQIVGKWIRDDLVHVYETVQADAPIYNPIWYRVFGGYMHRERLQKVRIHYNPPLSNIPESKLLAELTVPYAQLYRYSQMDGWTTTYRAYYSTIHWISAIDSGPDNNAWYRLVDEADESEYFIPTAQLRPILPEEITPLSMDVSPGKKHIDVNLKTQTLTCYENEQTVLTADVSTGLIGLYDTPTGQFNIEVKLPSRRMSGADRFATADENTLAGVPWCSFFTNEGHAFHGTYWHDNFGLPMSHGCVNMRNEDAKWLFRWSLPSAGFGEINPLTLDVRGFGTSVNIHS
jgi:lipoprotein-anchoring transpeptidase ErfK/SrfK